MENITITRTSVLRTLAGAAAALLLAACGDAAPHVDQAASAPLTEPTVSVQETGNTAVHVVSGSVHYRLDDARLLEVTLTVHSGASTPQTVTIRGSFYDKAGRLIDDATGSELAVAPGSDTTITLSGPTPHGTIASATFEITTIPSPTPISGGS